jgi:hypothetical protein
MQIPITLCRTLGGTPRSGYSRFEPPKKDSWAELEQFYLVFPKNMVTLLKDISELSAYDLEKCKYKESTVYAPGAKESSKNRGLIQTRTGGEGHILPMWCIADTSF